MKQFLLVTCSFIVLVVLGLAPGLTSAQAQAPDMAFSSLLVQLWPEYDRPEVLVIYRGELSSEVALPAQVEIRLPGYLEEMYAVAVEEEGSLLNVDPDTVSLVSEDDSKILSFPVQTPRFQFEYYDPVILTKQDQTRQLAYSYAPLHPVESASFEVQEPVQTQDFSMTPEPDESSAGQGGLTYNTVRVEGLAPGETFDLTATYSRGTDELSVSFLNDNSADEPVDISVVSGSPVAQDLNVGYLLVGAGVLLLLGTGGYWWWSKRTAEESPARSSARGSKRRLRRKPAAPDHQKSTGRAASSAAAGRPVGDMPTTPSGSFCYRCGTALRADADFCHACGAKRRRD